MGRGEIKRAGAGEKGNESAVNTPARPRFFIFPVFPLFTPLSPRFPTEEASVEERVGCGKMTPLLFTHGCMLTNSYTLSAG